MSDTSPEIASMVRERLLGLSGAERMLMGCQMFEAAKTIVLSSFPSGLSDIEIKARLCERFYGSEVNVEAFVNHLMSLQQSSEAF